MTIEKQPQPTKMEEVLVGWWFFEQKKLLVDVTNTAMWDTQLFLAKSNILHLTFYLAI